MSQAVSNMYNVSYFP